MVGFTSAIASGERATARVLNAFRRHGRIHLRAFGFRGRCCSVLNAFRRHGRIHRVVAHLDPDVAHVLNAFRRHGRIHWAGKFFSEFGGNVLNAFRRHGRIHQKKVWTSPRVVSAQRLSASWSDSLIARGG